MNEEKTLTNFQSTVSDLLIYNKSILDALAKFQESNAHLNKTIVKSVTSCGCTQIIASKKEIPVDASFADLKHILDTHLQGTLCENCQEIIEKSVGTCLFYLLALCNLLHIHIDDVIAKEEKHLKILGLYNLA